MINHTISVRSWAQRTCGEWCSAWSDTGAAWKMSRPPRSLWAGTPASNGARTVRTVLRPRPPPNRHRLSHQDLSSAPPRWRKDMFVIGRCRTRVQVIPAVQDNIRVLLDQIKFEPVIHCTNNFDTILLQIVRVRIWCYVTLTVTAMPVEMGERVTSSRVRKLGLHSFF